MDGQTLFSGSSQACRVRDRGRDVAQSGSQAVWGRDQHSDRLDATGRGYWQRCSGPDGRSYAEGGFGRPRGLTVAADQGRRFHHTGARCRACRTRPEGRLPLGVGLRACREAQLQKKAWRLANAIDPTWRGGASNGQSIKVASKLSDWSSSTRPGHGPIWLPCGDGRRAGAGFTPRFPTAAGRP